MPSHHEAAGNLLSSSAGKEMESELEITLVPRIPDRGDKTSSFNGRKVSRLRHSYQGSIMSPLITFSNGGIDRRAGDRAGSATIDHGALNCPDLRSHY